MKKLTAEQVLLVGPAQDRLIWSFEQGVPKATEILDGNFSLADLIDCEQIRTKTIQEMTSHALKDLLKGRCIVVWKQQE